MHFLSVLFLTLCFKAKATTPTTIDASRLMLRFFERAIWTSLDGEQERSACPQPPIGPLAEVLNDAKEQLDLNRPHCARMICDTFIAQQPLFSFEALEMKSMLVFFGLGGEEPNPQEARPYCNILRSIFMEEPLLCEERLTHFEWFKTKGIALHQNGQIIPTKQVKAWIRFTTPFLGDSQD